MSNLEKVLSLGQLIAEPEETSTGTNFRVTIDNDGVPVPVLLYLKKRAILKTVKDMQRSWRITS